MHLADPEVGDGVEPARLGQGSGVGEKAVDLAPLPRLTTGQTCHLHDLASDALHVGALGKVTLAVGAIEMS